MTVQSGQKFPSLNQTKAIPVDTGGSVVASCLVNGGTVTLNGTTEVTVADTGVTADSIIVFTLQDVNGGTQGAYPVATPTAGTGFDVKGTAADTGIYNWVRFG